MPSTDPPAGRRAFLKLLAASPLLAAAGIPERWWRALLTPGPVSAAPVGRGTPAGFVAGDVQADSLIASVEEALNVYDFRGVARRNIQPQHWAYIETGVNDDAADPRTPEVVLNDVAFDWLQLRPRHLPQLDEPDLSVELFGRRWETPIVLCPVASQRAFHPDGELATARAARSRGHLQMLSTVASTAVEEVNEARGEPVWYQLYASPTWGATRHMIGRVEEAGCPVLVWTIDLLNGSNRETVDRAVGPELRADRSACNRCHVHERGYTKPNLRGAPEGPPGDPFTWAYVARLKDATDMRVVVKGVETREQAERALEHGADGLVVSNHGGRAVAGGRSTIEALPEVVEAVGGRVPVILDSGIRRGTDIYKALALGADAVGIGRPYIWGLGAFGQEGVEAVLDLLTAELAMVMRQMGARSVAEISRDRLLDPTGRIL